MPESSLLDNTFSLFRNARSYLNNYIVAYGCCIKARS